MSEQGVQPRHQQLIMTIYGLYAREEGGAIPVAALIRMLGDLGVEEAGVRSSVSLDANMAFHIAPQEWSVASIVNVAIQMTAFNAATGVQIKQLHL